MNRPMLVICGVGLVAMTAIIFLANSLDPFTASAIAKTLFLVSAFIVTFSAAMLVLYAVAIAWHEGGQYFFARYFGLETKYFKFAFRRAILVSLLGVIFFVLRSYGFFNTNFVAGAVVIVLAIEVLASAHDRSAT